MSMSFAYMYVVVSCHVGAGIESDPLKVQSVLLATEPYFQPPIWVFLFSALLRLSVFTGFQHDPIACCGISMVAVQSW